MDAHDFRDFQVNNKKFWGRQARDMRDVQDMEDMQEMLMEEDVDMFDTSKGGTSNLFNGLENLEINDFQDPFITPSKFAFNNYNQQSMSSDQMFNPKKSRFGG